MYQDYRSKISIEIADAFEAALEGPYSLFIDDRPTGTGKTYQLPSLTRIAERHGVKRSFVLTPQKEQRDEICSKYFLQQYHSDEIIVITADGELFAKEAVWTDETKQIISALGLNKLIGEIDRQIKRHREGEKEYSRNNALENEKAGIVESERILGKYRSQIWKQLTTSYKYDLKKRCFLNKGTKERAFSPMEETALRRLFPMELDETGQYKVIIMTFQKNLHGMSQNTFDSLFFSSEITKDSAIFIDESDEFYRSILKFMVERALRSDVSLVELIEYIYRFIPKYSKNTEKLSENMTIAEAALNIRKDITQLFKEYGMFVDRNREHIRNLKLEQEDDGSIMIVQYTGITSDIGKRMCIEIPSDLSRPAVIRACGDKGNKDRSLRGFVQKALRIIDRTAGFIRIVSHILYGAQTRTDEEIILNGLSNMEFRDTFLFFMLAVIIPEKGGKMLRADKNSNNPDPFCTGITVTRFEDDPTHEQITRIRTLYVKMLPAYWMRAMIRNARFVMLISATACMDAMDDFPRRYISIDENENNICYELTQESRGRIQNCIMEMKKLQYGNTRQEVFISRYSTGCIYDNQKEAGNDEPPVLFPFGVSTVSNNELLANGGDQNLAFIIQQMIDVIRYRRSVQDETYVHEIYLSKGFKAAEIASVIQELSYGSREFADLFRGIVIGSITAGNISFLTDDVKNCRTDDIHIHDGQKVFIVSAYVSGGRGYDHTVYNDTDGRTYNISGISCKRPANILQGLTSSVSNSCLLECACNLINGGYICNDIEGTYRVLKKRLAGGNSCYHRDFHPDDELSPYKQTENAILAQTIGRFRMDTCVDITAIYIDRDILEKDSCLKNIQFEGRAFSYEMGKVLEATEEFYRKQNTIKTARYHSWNKQANDICCSYTKNKLPAAKNARDLKTIRECVKVLEAMKISSASAGSFTSLEAKEWLKDIPAFMKGFPVKVSKKDVQEYMKLFWNENLPVTAMKLSIFQEVLYEPVEFLSDIMPEGMERVRSAFAPLFGSEFKRNVMSGQRTFSMSEQGAGFLKGEIGERFAEEIFRYVIKHGAYSEFRIYSPEERLAKPFIYQYEDFDGILAPNVFWDAKNIGDDLAILKTRSKNIEEVQDSKSPDELENILKNKISRMPAGQMNYLIYFSTRFIGDKKLPEFYKPTNQNLLGKICRETKRRVTVVTISSLFTPKDAGLRVREKHNQLMLTIGKRVFERIIKEMQEERK